MEQIKLLEWEKERISEDMQREEALLDHVKSSFDLKKQVFVKYLGESSPYVNQVLPKAYNILLIKSLSFLLAMDKSGSQIIVGCSLNLDNIESAVCNPYTAILTNISYDA